MVQGKTSKI